MSKIETQVGDMVIFRVRDESGESYEIRVEHFDYGIDIQVGGYRGSSIITPSSSNTYTIGRHGLAGWLIRK